MSLTKPDRMGYISETLAVALKQARPAQRQFMREMYIHYENEWRRIAATLKDDPISRAWNFQHMIDKLVAKGTVPEGYVITCKKGCSHCCGLTVGAMLDEPILIGAYMQEQSIVIDPPNREQCPYLKDNLCQIYEVRPGACRKHFSVDSPDYCNFKYLGKREVLKWLSVEAEIFWSAVLNVAGTTEIYVRG
jgi:Fe-S-cluster containining protein